MTGEAATILVVDDEPQNRKLLEALLRPEGYRTVTAADGAEALASVARQAPDLILLDIMMPGMDGYQVATALKANPATSHIPIIMVTASVGREARMAGLNAGAEEFLMKPVDRGELWLRVRNLLRLKTLGDLLKNHGAILEQQVQKRTMDLQRSNDNIARLNRVYAVLSGINMLIVRVNDREELFREACRIAVNTGGFRLAWIATVDRIALRLRIAAWEGSGGDYIERMPLGLDESDPEGYGLAGSAVRDMKPVIVEDMSQDARVLLRSEATAKGFHSLAMLPLAVSGTVVGVLALYATETGFFNDDELKLLSELAGDIAFSIQQIERTAKLSRTTRVNAMLSDINGAIVRIRGRDALFAEACRIAVEAGALPFAWIGMVDSSETRLQLVASAGRDDGFLQTIRDRLALSGDKPETESLSWRAVRERRAVVVNEIAADTVLSSRKAFADRGINSVAVFPLVIADRVAGAFALHSDQAGFFDEDEMKLLREVAANIAFAVDHIARREQLDYLAYYDAQTGLANRTLFLERVALHMRSAAAAGHKLAVFLVDIERFKSINDSLGQAAGDALLRHIGNWLTLNLGGASLVARMGADHFALVLPEVKRDSGVPRLAEKVLAAFMAHPFRLDDAVFRLSAKVGVALFPDDATDADILLKHAEAALKEAKARGERCVFFQQKMTERVAGRLTLENQLRRALDNEEFVLHYQPKVNLEIGKLTSAEALIRWNDPRSGLVPPGKFIPILQETGLIYDVGRWALRKAVSEYLRWRAAGLSALRIAVNVSPLQLRNRGFTAEIQQVVGVDSLAAGGLELEITESVIMEDVKSSIAGLQAIRAMGVTIAIDDFGTGFSSLSYLSKLPVDTLKIDRSFVIDMTSGASGLSLVSTIISLAHSLKLKVVAEGVETEEQSRLLRLLRCDEMQGFLFSKPVPAEIFEARFLVPSPALVLERPEVA